MKYLKQFIVGSSIPVIILFYIVVKNIKKKNYKYYEYTLIAPIWFGLWNVVSLIIANKLNLKIRDRFLLISLISYFVIINFSKYFKYYSFTEKQWRKYYLYLLLGYLFIWNFVIYNIENLI